MLRNDLLVLASTLNGMSRLQVDFIHIVTMCQFNAAVSITVIFISLLFLCMLFFYLKAIVEEVKF